MQVSGPEVLLGSLTAGDTAILTVDNSGHGSVILVASNYPSLPAGNVPLVHLEDGFIEFRSDADTATKVEYQAVPIA